MSILAQYFGLREFRVNGGCCKITLLVGMAGRLTGSAAGTLTGGTSAAGTLPEGPETITGVAGLISYGLEPIVIGISSLNVL